MPSVEKKIRQAGWSKRPYKEAREEIGRFVATDGVVTHPPRKYKGKCRKNRGDHTLVYVKPKGLPNRNEGDQIQYWADMYSKANVEAERAKGRGWFWPNEERKVFRCSACGKMVTHRLKQKPA